MSGTNRIESHRDLSRSIVASDASDAGAHSDINRFDAILDLMPDAVVVADSAGRIRFVNQQTEALFGYAQADLLGQPVERLIPERFTAAHRRHRERYQAAPQTRPMGVDLQLFGRRRDGSDFPVEVSLSPFITPSTDRPGAMENVEGADRSIGVIATIRDISERKRLETDHAEAEAVTEELRRVQAITEVALTHWTLEALLSALLARLCAEMQVDVGAVLLMDADAQTLTVRAAYGLPNARAARIQVVIGQGIAGQIAANRQPLVVEDLSTSPVANRRLWGRLQSAAGVPLLVADQIIGVVQIGSMTRRAFTEREVRLLQLVADRIALAVDHARLYDAEQAALAQARISEARFQRLMESNAVGLLIVNETTALEANDAFLRMVGYTRADLEAGRVRRNIMNPVEFQDVTERAFQDTLAIGASVSIEKEIMRRDGSRVPVLVGGVALQQDPVRLLIVVTDLTEQRRLEEEQRWQASLLNQTHDAMFVWEWGGPISYWNRGAELLYGFSSEVAFGQDCHTLLRTSPEQVTEVEAQLARTGEWTGELVHTTRTGEQVTVLSRYQLLQASDDHRFVLESDYDVTERKRLEREQEEARARELAISEVNQQLDQFFSMAAHDIRNPVTVVRVSVQLALHSVDELVSAAAAVCAEAAKDGAGDTARAREKVRKLNARLAATHAALVAAEDGGDALSRLVVRLFDVASARAGKLDVWLAPCDLTRLVREQVETQRLANPGRVIELETSEQASEGQLDPQPVVVQGDEDRLGQVLVNYLTNALKYSSDTAPVRVRVAVVAGRAVVSVRDEGPGLPPDTLARVWELYRHISNPKARSRSEEASGRSLGLGLYICKRIIELHQGQVGAESEVGHGSTFWFALPLATAAEMAH